MFRAPLNCHPRLITALVMTGALLASATLVIAGPAAGDEAAVAYITAPNAHGTNSFCP